MLPVYPRQAVRLGTVRGFASDAKEKDDAAKASEARQEEHAEAAATGAVQVGYGLVRVGTGAVRVGTGWVRVGTGRLQALAVRLLYH